MDISRIQELWKKYLDNSLPEIEETEFFYLISLCTDAELADLLVEDDPASWELIAQKLPATKARKIYQDIVAKQNPDRDKSTPVRQLFSPSKKGWLAAASVTALLLLGGAIYKYGDNPVSKFYRPEKKVLSQGMAPVRRDKSFVRLEDGSSFLIDSLPAGKTIAGVYKSGETIHISSMGHNARNISVFTAFGHTQKVVLEDGTLIWLNAASTLTVLGMEKTSRKVALSGEAFFQVVHNHFRPFTVLAGGRTIEDLGTAFNVKCYAEELSFETTLLSGSVSVDHRLLSPGQQFNDGKIKWVDTSAAVAWKSGLFHFDKTEQHELLREIASWYGLEIVYDKELKPKYFEGEMQRSLPLDQMLELLSTMGIHYQRDGKRLLVKN